MEGEKKQTKKTKKREGEKEKVERRKEKGKRKKKKKNLTYSRKKLMRQRKETSLWSLGRSKTLNPLTTLRLWRKVPGIKHWLYQSHTEASSRIKTLVIQTSIKSS